MKSIRQSNFELLRVIAMFFIVFYHVIYHGKIIENCTNEGLRLIFTLLEYIMIIHVNLFILLTGYFQSKCKFKQSKVWSIINSSLFYKALIMVIFAFLGYLSLSKLDILKELFILNLNEYWFIKYYVFLYCLSPFLNKLIDSMSKVQYQKFLIVSFIIFSILPYITGLEAFSNDGYSLYNFIFLYFIGAYLRNYPIEENYIFKRCSKNLLRIILLFIFISCPIMNYLITTTSISLLNINSIIDEIAHNFISLNIAYSNPFIIIQAISFFLLFSIINIKSRFINNVSKLTIGIYLIHDNNLVREKLYTVTNINTGPINSYLFIIYALVIAIAIFVICAIIEKIRQAIFKFIYDRRVSIKIREKYYSFLRSISIKKVDET